MCHHQAIRVLGLLGALDPYKHKVNIGMIDQSRDASAVSLSESKSSQDSGRPLCTFSMTVYHFCFLSLFHKVIVGFNFQCNSWKTFTFYCVSSREFTGGVGCYEECVSLMVCIVKNLCINGTYY